ncbi:hypothetical protein C6W96_08085 [Streptomyces sp. CS149]|uniref:DUF5304 domain-containing protein n=2 Tax=Streptomyces filamentosus TaxID=67294 RepID=A0ABY4V115_STRFL|nr:MULTISPECIES: DUF5304 domain-containing protein [Streptomyces]MCC8480399.1 DUF5304 domain-containing protein [Streptomyces globisporus]EFE73903.1 conserved hypothetical protein [Streptomyces filamentosus NRRL 15998]ESU47612.1 hypothetical protein P376_4414 [Streptomyces sp. HCCB10043]EWS91065.1 hypothetical protein SSIG_01464 [Streptomyces filamentosus NRRL 11379]MYR78082.1 hypothetical protein [Streptomyces sp. SID5466]
MSEATDRPVDGDAWADACAEDLAAEKARRRAQYGPPPGSAAEELRKLVDAVADKVSSLQTPLLGVAAQGAVQQAIRQARSAVEPVIERNPQVFDHLAAAGNELLAAYRSAVEGQESRWTRTTEGASGTAGPSKKAADDPSDPRDEGPSGTERIDLD